MGLKTNNNQKGFGVVEVLMVSFVLVVLGLITYHFLSSNPKASYDIASKLNNSKVNSLNSYADQKGQTLSQIKILDGQVTQAKGIVDGDATADPNPDKSTYATASFTTNSTLATIESQASINLQRSGFTREGPSDRPYYKTYTVVGNTGPPLGTAIEFRYINGSNAIKLSYIFDKAYGCPAGKVCGRTAKSLPSDDIYDVRGYASLNVIKINAIYAKQSNYLVQL